MPVEQTLADENLTDDDLFGPSQPRQLFGLPARHVWLAIGMVIYLAYGRHHSVLGRDRPPSPG